MGKALDYGFKSKNRTFIHDKFIKSLSLQEVVKNSEIIFVSVPTPMNKAYTKIDLSIVNEVVGNTTKIARELKTNPIIVVKSTVVPGTTEKLSKKYNWPQMFFNPEFLTEANYLQDFVNSDRVVIGGKKGHDMAILVNLYKTSFPKTKIFTTNATSAEMVKYMANTYLATKVIFANEMFDLCEKLGIDYKKVKPMVVADRRIYDSHLDITEARGFGGKCFPKDTVALLGLGKELGVKMDLLETAWKKNLKIRKVRDWEEIPGAVSKK